jgi:hypothetical protein
MPTKKVVTPPTVFDALRQELSGKSFVLCGIIIEEDSTQTLAVVSDIEHKYREQVGAYAKNAAKGLADELARFSRKKIIQNGNKD